MRILYVAFADLGVPRAWTVHVLATCRELRALGHEVYLVTPAPSQATVEPGIPWRRIDGPREARVGLLRFHAAVWRGLPQWMSEADADLVYVREVPFAWWLPGRVQRTGRPIVVEVNGIVLDEAREMSRLRRWAFGTTERRQLVRADGVVAVSAEVAERLRSLYPALRNIEVVPNGVEVERFDRMTVEQARRELGIGEGPCVGFVGGFFDYRALDRLVEAIGLVRRRIPQARLLLVGDGPTRPSLEGRSPEGVRFVGDVPPDRVPTYLAAMDVCVLLSTVPAGTSIKIFEYMAARRPIVASRGGGVGRLIEETGSGLTVESHSPEAISEALVALLSDEPRSRAMGERGGEAVRERFTWRRSAERLAEYLGTAVTSRRAGVGEGDA